IRLGSAKVTRSAGGRETVLTTLAADDYFGHVALLADDPVIGDRLTGEEALGRRTASVTALDPVEVVRVPGPAFRELCEAFPDLRRRLVADASALLSARTGAAPASKPRLGEYLD